MKRFEPFVCTLVGLVIAAGSIHAVPAQQASATGERLAFEVASIKANESEGHGIVSGGGCHGIGENSDPSRPALGRCVYSHVTLKALISGAYFTRLLPNQTDQLITGGPNWMSTDFFDIEAKAEDASTATQERLKTMVQTLLSERFKLKFHREAREVPGYFLELAQNGAKLKESVEIDGRQSMQFSSGRPVAARNVSALGIANFLSDRLGRPVVDRTGLTGKYDFTLSWMPADGELGPGGSGAAGAPAFVSDPLGPSLIVAIQEQLGLRLQSQRVPVEVLVIDHVEKPSLN